MQSICAPAIGYAARARQPARDRVRATAVRARDRSSSSTRPSPRSGFACAEAFVPFGGPGAPGGSGLATVISRSSTGARCPRRRSRSRSGGARRCSGSSCRTARPRSRRAGMAACTGTPASPSRRPAHVPAAPAVFVEHRALHDLAVDAEHRLVHARAGVCRVECHVARAPHRRRGRQFAADVARASGPRSVRGLCRRRTGTRPRRSRLRRLCLFAFKLLETTTARRRACRDDVPRLAARDGYTICVGEGPCGFTLRLGIPRRDNAFVETAVLRSSPASQN